MNEIIVAIAVGAILSAAFIIPQEIARRREEKERDRLLAKQDATPDNSPEIWQILVPVYTKLRRAGASCRPWIHDCIVAIEEGQGCDPVIALAALTETGEDLAGTRWDTDGMAETFGQAAEKLAALI